MLIKDIDTILKFRWIFHRFIVSVLLNKGKTELQKHSSLFYQDKPYLIEKGNKKLSESIITATVDANFGQYTHFNKMKTNKHNQFMKTYKMAKSFKLHNARFPPLIDCSL